MKQMSLSGQPDPLRTSLVLMDQTLYGTLGHSFRVNRSPGQESCVDRTAEEVRIANGFGEDRLLKLARHIANDELTAPGLSLDEGRMEDLSASCGRGWGSLENAERAFVTPAVRFLPPIPVRWRRDRGTWEASYPRSWSRWQAVPWVSPWVHQSRLPERSAPVKLAPSYDRQGRIGSSALGIAGAYGPITVHDAPPSFESQTAVAGPAPRQPRTVIRGQVTMGSLLNPVQCVTPLAGGRTTTVARPLR